MVAAFGELTAGPVLPRLRDKMLATGEGRAILKERPRINTKTVDIAALSDLPEGTLGRAYINWLERCGVTPDTRAPVRSVVFVSSVHISLTGHLRFITSMIRSSPT
jgi:ubiquinone biosynthesis protein COQ4